MIEPLQALDSIPTICNSKTTPRAVLGWIVSHIVSQRLSQVRYIRSNRKHQTPSLWFDPSRKEATDASADRFWPGLSAWLTSGWTDSTLANRRPMIPVSHLAFDTQWLQTARLCEQNQVLQEISVDQTSTQNEWFILDFIYWLEDSLPYKTLKYPTLLINVDYIIYIISTW